MKHIKVVLTALLVSAVLCGCGKKNDVIVTVNDKDITAKEFQQKFDAKINSPEFKNYGVNLSEQTNNPISLVIKNIVIDEMIVTTLIDEEIAKRKIEVTDKDVDEYFNNLVKTLGSEEQLKASLKKNNISIEQFKKDLQTELKYRTFINQIAKVSVSDKEAQKFYNNNLPQFNMPERVRASHILVKANKDEIKGLLKQTEKGKTDTDLDKMVDEEMAKRLAKAQKILAQVKKDPSKFEQIAKQESDDTVSAKQGGDLGIFTYQQMVEPFSKAAFSQKPNTVSDKIITTTFGYHIIFVRDKMVAGKQPFDKVKDQIKSYLEMQQRNKVVMEFVENAKKSAKIEYKDESYKPEVIEAEIKKIGAQLQQQKAGAPADESKAKTKDAK